MNIGEIVSDGDDEHLNKSPHSHKIYIHRIYGLRFKVCDLIAVQTRRESKFDQKTETKRSIQRANEL